MSRGLHAPDALPIHARARAAPLSRSSRARSLLGTCDQEGRHTFDRDDLREKIEAMLARFATQGLALVALACLVQVPWILAMVEIVPNVAYEILAR